MGLFDFLQRKESATRQAMVIGQVGSPRHTDRNYRAMADEGFKSNVIVYRAIQLISQCAAQVEWELYSESGAEPVEIEDSPLLDLLENPNSVMGAKQFFENAYAFLLMSGNSYIEYNAVANPELWNVRPDYVQVIPGAYGVPAAYQFQAGGERRIFPVDQVTGRSAIGHLKLFNPTNDWYGMSPMESAFLSVDQHNNAGRWNLALLQNNARPSGAMMVEMTEFNPAGKLTDEQFSNMKSQIDELYSGAKNAGRPMLLEGGLSWTQMSMNVKDMDWLNGKNISAREIALALGVPPLLLNISGDNTYNNMKEARLALYEETIIPLVCHMRDELQRWLVPMFGDNLKLYYDEDSIDGTILKRDIKFDIANKGKDFLTVNERRDLVGYEPMDGGDDLPGAGAEPVNAPANDPNQPEVQQQQETANPQAPQQGQGQDAVDQQAEDMPKSFHHDLSLFDEIKVVNLITKTDKQRAARAMARKRDSLASAFEMDLQDVFEKMNKSFSKITTDQEKLAEMQALAIIADHTDDFEKVFKKHLRRAALDFARPILASGKEFNPKMEVKKDEWFNSWLDNFVKTHTARNVSNIQGTTDKKAREKIKGIVAEGIRDGSTSIQIGDALVEEMDSLSAGRARTIARTEVGIATQTGSLEAAKAMDIPGLKKEWVSIQDDRTRDGESPNEADHLSMDGQQVEIDDVFAVYVKDDDVTLMTGPGDPSAGANNLVNCRCALIFVPPKGR
jgi:HK97 family phage portal protein